MFVRACMFVMQMWQLEKRERVKNSKQLKCQFQTGKLKIKRKKKLNTVARRDSFLCRFKHI